ncbi:hypothetical protein DOS80_07190, partial [Staphylococcus felis]
GPSAGPHVGEAPQQRHRGRVRPVVRAGDGLVHRAADGAAPRLGRGGRGVRGEQHVRDAGDALGPRGRRGGAPRSNCDAAEEDVRAAPGPCPVVREAQLLPLHPPRHPWIHPHPRALAVCGPEHGHARGLGRG